MNVYILTLFPDEMRSFFYKGILKKALDKGIFKISFINIRQFSNSKHFKVDDYPFGVRKGLILKADVLYRAITSIDSYKEYRIVYTCPKGSVFNQRKALNFSKQKGLIILSGYYEGVDERIFDLLNIEKVSLGDVVLSSGELPSLVFTEATLRLIPGVIGNPDSVDDDSILNGLLEYPHYTVPRVVEGVQVPGVLLSGHHQHIQNWQRRSSLKETLLNKPELLSTFKATPTDQKEFVEILKEA